MRYIYVDNFRGFSNSLIPIKDVNFLVGDNSTGKSSILSLIYLMSRPKFWMDQEFNTEEFHFGGFKDIISAESDNKKSFRIGMIDSQKESNTGKIKSLFFLFTFRDEEGQPAVYKYTRLDGSQIIKMLFFRSKVQYKVEEVRKPSSLEAAKKLFDEVQRIEKEVGRGFKEIPGFNLKGHGIFFLANSIIDSLIKGKKPTIGPMSINVPLSFINVAWLAPVRTKPKRTYDGFRTSFTSEGDHTPYVIRKILSSKTEAEQFRVSLSRFGSASGLFKNVSVRAFSPRDPSSPFEVQVVLMKRSLNLNNVGYGVSQILPIVVEILAGSGYKWFVFQQPEIHLHPRGQAAFGDLLYQIAAREKKCFLIETHSDFTIDRFRLNYRRKSKKKVSSQVLFFERSRRGNSFHTISIDRRGNYEEKQPLNFRKFFIREEMKLLGL